MYECVWKFGTICRMRIETTSSGSTMRKIDKTILVRSLSLLLHLGPELLLILQHTRGVSKLWWKPQQQFPWMKIAPKVLRDHLISLQVVTPHPVDIFQNVE